MLNHLLSRSNRVKPCKTTIFHGSTRILPIQTAVSPSLPTREAARWSLPTPPRRHQRTALCPEGRSKRTRRSGIGEVFR